MAKRRMFCKGIVQSSRFLKMPVSSRELYFQLSMSADDDGIVEAWNVMRLTNAREDDLRVLVSKGYVQILNHEDLIAYLTDWNTNNTIRKDRYQESIYKDLLLMISENDNQMTTNGQPLVNQVTTIGQPSDNHCETQYRLGKYSIDKDSIGKDSIGESEDPQSVSTPSPNLPSIPLKDNTEWYMTEELYKEYQKSYPTVDIAAELGKMRMWCISNPGRKKTRKGITKFVNNWLSTSLDDQIKKSKPQQSNMANIKI